ncbi:hypothetical protein AAFF_G00396050 [Aldrovandia affinis]|uniref:Uncharacterized protein n=1 Tax=Aldrovandia affinis TaxID=143900 RepID=A0AAD7WKL5_9TELE|nr:hypothetical protein AAFF_G00396050 [Aldrovandia affinis]
MKWGCVDGKQRREEPRRIRFRRARKQWNAEREGQEKGSQRNPFDFSPLEESRACGYCPWKSLQRGRMQLIHTCPPHNTAQQRTGSPPGNGIGAEREQGRGVVSDVQACVWLEETLRPLPHSDG